MASLFLLALLVSDFPADSSAEPLQSVAVPTSVHAQATPTPASGFVNVRTDFNATGDGNHDDYIAIQAAIDFCRQKRLGLYFPSGHYSVSQPLDFGTWRGILVEGGEPSDNGVNGFDATVRLSANLAKPADACFDFSGCGYGRISGLAFDGNGCKVMVLNARTAGADVSPGQTSGGDIYGSDLTYERCNFGQASVASFANHMGEVLTWRDCRFHSGGGTPGLLMTWRLDDPDGPWNVSSNVRNLTRGITLTMFRMYGGEFTADNSPNIILDMDGTPGCKYNPDFSHKKNAATFSIHGTYFAQIGSNLRAIEVRGHWRNVMIDANRAEFVGDAQDSSIQFLKLAGENARLSNFRLHTYGDGDASHPIIAGEGDVFGGTVIGSGIVNMKGRLVAVSFHTESRFNMTVDGDVVDTAVSAAGGIAGLNVTGKMSIDDGAGGRLIYYGAAQTSGTEFLIDQNMPSGLFHAAFNGSSLLLHCASNGVKAACAEISHLNFGAAGPGGQLTWNCATRSPACIILASQASDLFSVRRMGERGPPGWQHGRKAEPSEFASAPQVWL